MGGDCHALPHVTKVPEVVGWSVCRYGHTQSTRIAACDKGATESTTGQPSSAPLHASSAAWGCGLRTRIEHHPGYMYDQDFVHQPA